jgi:hypothetical protein
VSSWLISYQVRKNLTAAGRFAVRGIHRTAAGLFSFHAPESTHNNRMSAAHSLSDIDRRRWAILLTRAALHTGIRIPEQHFYSI